MYQVFISVLSSAICLISLYKLFWVLYTKTRPLFLLFYYENNQNNLPTYFLNAIGEINFRGRPQMFRKLGQIQVWSLETFENNLSFAIIKDWKLFPKFPSHVEKSIAI